jgi:PAS domain S-box-containing protein
LTCILFVDDDASLLDVGKIFLEENEGFSVHCTLSGDEALGMMAARKFDAVVSDYQMPGMDGITLLKKVRATNKTLPFILFTGKGREEVAIEALNEGADFYLQKGGAARVQYAELAHKIRMAAERRSAEAALYESENLNRKLVENIPDYVVVYGPDGKILYANPASAQALGYRTEELIGKSVLTYVTEDYQATAAARLASRRNGKDTSLYEIEITGKGGLRRQVMVKGTPIQYGDNPATLLVLIDITDRNRADEVVQQVIKKLTLLSGITRHEINNQLIALDGYLTILKKKIKDPSLTEIFQKTTFATERISSMIEFTKEYEKIGIHAPIWQDCRTLIGTAGQQAPLGQIKLKNDLPAGDEIFADPLISLVIYNLMDNAVRYGGKITTLQVASENQNGNRIIIFDDDGEGVPVEEKEKIFEYGFGKNTGMGLFLAREILGITGITIRETGEPGKGARFEVMVPKGMWREGEVKNGGSK